MRSTGLARCNACRNFFGMTIQLGYEPRQHLLGSCPHCEAAIRCHVTANAPDYDFQSAYVEFPAKDKNSGIDTTIPTIQGPWLTLSADIPQHYKSVHERTPWGPFMEASQFIGNNPKKARTYPMLHPRWETTTALLESIVAAHLTGRNKDVRDRCARLKSCGIEVQRNVPRSAQVTQAFRAIAMSVRTTDVEDALTAWRQRVKQAQRSWTFNHPQTKSPIINERRFSELRRKVWNACRRLSASSGAMLAAQMGEMMLEGGKVEVKELRLTRGDYDELSSTYIRAFEAFNQVTSAAAVIDNLAERGDARQFDDGVERSFKTLFDMSASEREAFIHASLKALYDRVSRNRRNRIGHAVEDYDFVAGDLVYDDDKREPFVSFVLELLHLWRFGDVAMEIIGSLELLMSSSVVDKAISNDPVVHFPPLPEFMGAKSKDFALATQ